MSIACVVLLILLIGEKWCERWLYIKRIALQYNRTIEAVYAVEHSVDMLLDLLQIYREKAGDKMTDKGGSIFTKACFLLILLVQDHHRAVVRKSRKVTDILTVKMWPFVMISMFCRRVWCKHYNVALGSLHSLSVFFIILSEHLKQHYGI